MCVQLRKFFRAVLAGPISVLCSLFSQRHDDDDVQFMLANSISLHVQSRLVLPPCPAFRLSTFNRCLPSARGIHSTIVFKTSPDYHRTAQRTFSGHLLHSILRPLPICLSITPRIIMSAHSHPSSSSSLTSSAMEMIFSQSTSTPLYSSLWTPSSTAAYAGTCIFLILLAAFSRFLLAGKVVLQRKWSDKELNRQYVTIRGQPSAEQLVNESIAAKTGILITERGPEEHVRVLKSNSRPVLPWRFSVDLPRAVYSTVVVGISYLL